MFFTITSWLFVAVLIPVGYLYVNVKPKRSVEIDSIPVNSNEGKVRRNILSPDKLVTGPVPSVTTLYELLVHAAKTFGPAIMLGQRSVLKVVEEEKQVTKIVGGEEQKETKKWKFFALSSYDWMTYSEVKEAAEQIGAGLKHLGLGPQQKLTIFAATSRDWLITAHACFTQSITITTAYDTLGADGLSFSLNEGEVTTLFTNAELLNLMSDIASKVPTLTNIVYNMGMLAPAQQASISFTIEEAKAAHPHLRFYSLQEVRQLGVQYPADPTPPKPEDVACIMYTSGSTGNPKGVVLTHKNIIAAVGGAYKIIEKEVSKSDVYLAYLPLAHILEFLVENSAVFCGCPLGYGTPRTLTDASVRECKGDIRELRPTVMAGVPAVWETIRKGVLAKLADATPLQKRIFSLACQLKWSLIQLRLPSSFLDVIFKKIKDNTGGRLRFALSGGAPLPRETHQFLTTVLCPILQGYGMTETCGLIAICSVDQVGVLGEVGPPGAATEVKLVDVPDTNYSVKNKPYPQGEVWVRGGSVTSGYYKQPQVTAETLTSDGWLMTGDIGEWHPDGSLAIIDRKKNLVKLSHGEYIALERLEALYKTAPFVQNICIYADSEKSFPVAIVVPIEKDLAKWALENSIFPPGTHVELKDLAHKPEAEKAVAKALTEVAKKVGLKGAELLGKICLAEEEWTPHNGFLTAAQKIKRKDICKKYQPQIDAMYSAKKK
ncbi:long-chain fatty acid-CoA ligase [Quaeritorhiza haematococci]|nr:long-chain fatty acid-CoA ligase [Quaeritorhiza haematococci]